MVKNLNVDLEKVFEAYQKAYSLLTEYKIFENMNVAEIIYTLEMFKIDWTRQTIDNLRKKDKP